ncbi:hypothetical protein AAF712_010873 [Marasmius tenuissimus]|uniref:Uncharacterized protein n=1 Tax=Marasmius tenuissimus TaxID=585030 RepID=A0ABR2ZLI7_9AGAR
MGLPIFVGGYVGNTATSLANSSPRMVACEELVLPIPASSRWKKQRQIGRTSLNAQPPSSPSSTRPVKFNGVLIGWVLYVGSLDGVEAHSNLKSAHDALKVALSEGPAIIILAQEIEQAADANHTMQLSYTLEHAELEDEPEGAK